MNLIKIGKIVTTHGIKGEIKILSNFELKKEVFKIGNKIYIGKEYDEEIINSYRVHKNYDMITLKGYTNINEVLKFKNKFVYVNRDDLSNDKFIIDDLIGFSVIIDNNVIGVVSSFSNIKNNPILIVKSDKKEIYIPYHNDFIINIDNKNKTITVKYIEGLI